MSMKIFGKASQARNIRRLAAFFAVCLLICAISSLTAFAANDVIQVKVTLDSSILVADNQSIDKSSNSTFLRVTAPDNNFTVSVADDTVAKITPTDDPYVYLIEPLTEGETDFTLTYGETVRVCTLKIYSNTLMLGVNTLLIGMGTVFSVLALLWLVLAIFKVIFVKKDKKPETPVSEPAPVAAPAVTDNSDSSSEGETVAAITAAIAMYLSEESGTEVNTGSFRVVSFKRADTKKAWNHNN